MAKYEEPGFAGSQLPAIGHWDERAGAAVTAGGIQPTGVYSGVRADVPHEKVGDLLVGGPVLVTHDGKSTQAFATDIAYVKTGATSSNSNGDVLNDLPHISADPAWLTTGAGGGDVTYPRAG